MGMVRLLYDRRTRSVDIGRRVARIGLVQRTWWPPPSGGCVRSHSRPNARIMEVERRLGASIMRHALFGLTLLPLIACGAAAGESAAPNSASSVSQNVAPSPPHQAHRAKNSKHGSGTQSGGSPVPGSLPLSTTTAYTAEHSPSFPISTVPKATPESNSWTGFFLGVGAGAGTQP